MYLDDHTSNVEITGNVFVDTSANAIFFHSGNYNVARNNVFVNATQLAEKKGAQLLFKVHLQHLSIYLGMPSTKTVQITRQ